MNPILCIDPGGSGGMAIARHDGTVEAYPMRDGITAQIDAGEFQSLAKGIGMAIEVLEEMKKEAR